MFSMVVWQVALLWCCDKPLFPLNDLSQITQTTVSGATPTAPLEKLTDSAEAEWNGTLSLVFRFILFVNFWVSPLHALFWCVALLWCCDRPISPLNDLSYIMQTTISDDTPPLLWKNWQTLQSQNLLAFYCDPFIWQFLVSPLHA